MTESKMQLEDWLDDLCVRFIINLPSEELESVERICFQIEEAQWFYEDFIRPLDPALPSLSLKDFSFRLFAHCPLMSQWSHYHHVMAFSTFLAYKTRVPVRGAILLNEEMDSVVLVKGWKKGANWSFPRGKINKGEPDLECAIREVYEETGFDVREAGLIQDGKDVKSIEVTMREQHMRLFIFPRVPMDTYFEPRTRKEISKIEWYKLSDLPTLKRNKQHEEGMTVANANKFYMVAPFLHPLKKWIAHQKRLAAKTQGAAKQPLQSEGYVSMDENGYRTNGTAAEMAMPSDLPEVTSAPDASLHIKQLLNIGGAPLAHAEAQAPQMVQPAHLPAVDQTKSNALLALLRKGSQDPVPQVRNESMAQPTGLPTAQPAHLPPNFFPGFPQQQQHMAPSNFMQQTSAQPLQEPPRGASQPAMYAHQAPSLPPTRQPELPGSSGLPQIPHMSPTNYLTRNAQPPPSHVMPTRHAAAPFQQTGDPQFSQLAQQAQLPGAVVPSASKLPPPTLTSHSMALLNFFKDNTAKTPQLVNAAPASVQTSASAPAPVPETMKVRKTSQHQDSLLNLFKGPSAAASQPAELSGQPVLSAPPPEKQILQRPSQQTDLSIQPGKTRQKTQAGVVHTSATVSGPMNIPQFDAIPKSSTRKATNGSSRKSNNNRRDQAQTQQLSSPITILPRPQAAKRDVSISEPIAQPSPIRSHVPVPQPAAPEPVKPFQPQILRRSDKSGYENLLMTTSKTGNEEHKQSLPGFQGTQAELAPDNKFDRRPSQTAAQKEALLSLFGKPAVVSPPPTSAVKLDSRSINQVSTAASGLVSPLSSLHFHSSGDSISRRGTPSENEVALPSVNRVSSPTNKAFLLGYLQGVAKGSK
ncbi:hypothetical protein N7462_004589 [Penicillium macrosclerotiorum]|uniref:uncharacterized protein n=1 Tax=Penicillium macrosclerotiorum TaxID=303699 RepID=UPI002547C499|nr:uncharacterized protein N7462_004589 [Penicillium macrosclerotiorum]KAJ5690197.1 hypothetical protein N7462_004589 [Penicillium macrosclerotiorum]